MKKLTTIVLILSIIFSNINCKTGIFNEAPNKPTINSPSNSATLEEIPSKLDWNCIDADNDILKYEVYFGTENPPALLASDIEESEYSGIPVESNKTYYWKIIAEDEHGDRAESGVWTFSIGNFPPETPVNPIPENNSIEQNPTTISWECTEPEGEALTYDVYFGTTETPELIEENYTTNSYELPELTGNQKYYWKIIAKDTYGNEINGILWNFTTDVFAPETIYPINNEQNAAWFPKLTWNSNNNSGNFTYDVYLGTSSNPELLVSNLTDTSYHSDRLTKDQIYYWKVIAKSENGATAESPVWSFKVFGEPELSTFFDVRDNKTYQTVKIGNQTWFAENLKYFVEGSRVYNDDISYENIYGRLYTWTQMMNGEEASDANPSGVQGIAPPGAHIPSETEWYELINFLGGVNIASKYLKASGTEFWDVGNEGTNESGFTAIGGGLYDWFGENNSYYFEKGYAVTYLSSSITNQGYFSADIFLMKYNDNRVFLSFLVALGGDAMYLRCIID